MCLFGCRPPGMLTLYYGGWSYPLWALPPLARTPTHVAGPGGAGHQPAIAPHLGVAEGRTLPGRSVDLGDRGTHVDGERGAARAGPSPPCPGPAPRPPPSRASGSRPTCSCAGRCQWWKALASTVRWPPRSAPSARRRHRRCCRPRPGPRRSRPSPWSPALACPGESRRSTLASTQLRTPSSSARVIGGTAVEIRARRAETLDAAYAANPCRFGDRRPSPPKLPTAAWINQPTIQNDAQKRS